MVNIKELYKKINFYEKKEAKRILKKALGLKKKMKDDKYYHLSNKKIDEIKTITSRKSHLSSIFYNPRGFWISCGSSWIDFCLDNYQVHWLKSKYLYEIEVNDSVKKIKNIKEFTDFFGNYLNKKVEKFKDLIDWNQIKKDYHGLIICPYLGNKIWKNKEAIKSYGFYNEKLVKSLEKIFGKELFKHQEFIYEWYRHWETATGVIWNKKGIKEIKLIYEKN